MAAAVVREAPRVFKPKRTAAGGMIVRGLPALLALPTALACGSQGTIVPPPSGAASVAVSPATTTLTALGRTVRLDARVLDRNGKSIPGVSIAWSSGDEAVASVDRDGLVTANGNGVVAVEAASGSVRGHALVTVEQRAARIDISPLPDTLRSLGDTVRLAAGGVDASGHAIPPHRFRWASSDTSVATVNSAGLVTAAGNGSASVSAAIGDTASSVNVVVYDTIARDVARDRAALTAVYNAMNGDAWVRAANWLGDGPLSTWYGVSTDSLGRVTRLSLPSNSLSGLFPPEIGDLANLEELRLENGAIRWIPPEIGKLSNLRVLHLYNNLLAGRIPPELGKLTRLVSLSLWGNRLAGPLPPELGELASLEYLDLSQNRLLGGDIPPELGNLSNLKVLILYQSSMTGSIPPELGKLINLRVLGLSYNRLEGGIPSELGNLVNLEVLSLAHGLSGPIPSELGNLTNLVRLSLGNGLSGPIPPELGRLTNLVSLSLDGRLTGSIPPELGDLADLTALDLHDNQLAGPVPATFGRLARLERLDLHGNHDMTGPLPASMAQLMRLLTLYIDGTALCVPSEPVFSRWLATVGDFRGDRCSG